MRGGGLMQGLHQERTMRATQAFIEQTGGPEVIQWREVDLPAPARAKC